MAFDRSCTVDLGGNTLYKNYVSEYGSARILVEGESVLFKNGKIVSSMTSVAEVNSGELRFLYVDISFEIISYENLSIISFWKIEVISSMLLFCTL